MLGALGFVTRKSRHAVAHLAHGKPRPQMPGNCTSLATANGSKRDSHHALRRAGRHPAAPVQRTGFRCAVRTGWGQRSRKRVSDGEIALRVTALWQGARFETSEAPGGWGCSRRAQTHP